VRYEVFAAASIKMTVFLSVLQCSLIEIPDVSEVLSASIIRTIIALVTEAQIEVYSALRQLEKKMDVPT
jgi:hypothetical protein